MSQPHKAEMPIYFLVRSPGKAVTPRLANTKIDQYPSVFFSLFFFFFSCISHSFHAHHVYKIVRVPLNH